MNHKIIAFDADDTLWHNETLYRAAEVRFGALMSKYVSADELNPQLFQTEIKNLEYFGYGIKSFALSMIETAGRITQGCISSAEILEIIDIARAMLDAPVELLPNVNEVIKQLSADYYLMIVTKGDLLDQNRKLERSGLAAFFDWVEVVTDKTSQVYADLFKVHKINPKDFLMVGNSLRSDILPVVALGAHAVYIPYALTWAHEDEIEHLSITQGYAEIEAIAGLPKLIEELLEFETE